MNKSMIRKLVQSFVFTLIIAYFILLGLFGEEGLLHARSIQRELVALRQRQEVLLLQIDSLEQQNQRMSSQDALKDAAFRFGYQEEGEQVFYFTDEGDGEFIQQERDSIPQAKKRTFAGFAKLWIALMALVISSLFTVVWGIRTQRRDRYR